MSAGQGGLLAALSRAAPERHARVLRLIGEAPHPLPGGAIGHGLEFAALEAVLDGLTPPALPARLRDAVRPRQLSHAAGRYCAELGLLALTGTDGEVPTGPAGEPLWPSGVSGSITHAGGGAWAAVGRSAEVGTLGLDTEVVVDAAGLADILAVCVTPGERERWFRSCPTETAAELATALFSAKESLYKALHPRVRRFVDFTEVEMVDRCEQLRWLRLRPASTSALADVFDDLTVNVRREGVRVHTATALAR
ncbi:4'-phosphopantetheinyl transferase superfamily protein [Mitsuaria sp. GD03876]|uniref:4'-phosphopantetheinyl transferase family protein n=1 Tax=Mitsuaria sp. GD03876 TaxID=2975399 RepID=UPI00244B492A|nr:4'-phosphopantetheinyl transferase superfamily protein [Mitsuaria sp. GD03876]MDH0865601.1 4'-phosphopantetheinyl transferase superfamily protein [Mitsuaria sp. GD03876]